MLNAIDQYRPTRRAIFILSAGLMSGCSTSNVIDDNTTSAFASPVIGEWIIEDIAGGGIIDSTQPSLVFSEDGSLSGSATCNRIISRYEIKPASATDGTIALQPIGLTMMACPEALMNQEQTLLDLLKRVDRFEIIDHGALKLVTDDDRTIIARQTAASVM